MAKPNVLLITVDCLRPDRLGCYGYSHDTSPNIDKLASRGALFRQAIANGGRTPDSFPSILASQLPPLDEEEYRVIMRDSPSLAGVLKDAGYRTAAFHSNPFLSTLFHYHKGFDVYEDNLGILTSLRKRRVELRIARRGKAFSRIRNRLGATLNLIMYLLGKQRDITAENLTRRALSWLQSGEGNFFLWLHFMDAHNPYLPPTRCLRSVSARHISRHRMIRLQRRQIRTFRRSNIRLADWVSPTEVADLSELYHASIRYVDESIGSLLDSLGNELRRTVVLLTADHGEAFGEHNSLAHSTLYEELVRVPLVVAGPGVVPGTVVEEPVQLMALAPTIADLVRVRSAPAFRGKSLLPALQCDWGFEEGVIATRLIPEFRQRLVAYRIPGWKYIRTESLDHDNNVLSEEVYNLRDDPGEQRNLNSSDDEQVRGFHRMATEKVVEFKHEKTLEKMEKEKDRISARIRKMSKS